MAVAPHHYIAHYDYHATFCRFVVALFVLWHILFYFLSTSALFSTSSTSSACTCPDLAHLINCLELVTSRRVLTKLK